MSLALLCVGVVRFGFRLQWLAFGSVLTWCAGWVVQADAYCRQRSCQDESVDVRSCERNSEDCITEGIELQYTSPCLTFAIAGGDGHVVGLEDAQFELMVLEAFETWATVDCGEGRSPGFLAVSAGIVAADEPNYCSEAPDENLGVFFFRTNWEDDANVLGFTYSSFLPRSGRVVDADVELNADYVNSVPVAGKERLLRAVVEHEVGHFLGLAHSNDPDSVMSVEYDPRVAILPTLTQDDIDGICAIFPPSSSPVACPQPQIAAAALYSSACEMLGDGAGESSEACSVAATGKASRSGASLDGLLLAALLGVVLRVSRTRRRSRSAPLRARRSSNRRRS